MPQDPPTALDRPSPAAPHERPPQLPGQQRNAPPRKSRLGFWLLIFLVVIGGGYYLWSRKPADNAGGGKAGAAGQKRGPMAIPVVGIRATKGDIPVYYTGLGAVTPINTVTIRTRVDGQLMSVNYKEGDLVKQGAPLLEIDPRPYQVQLTQAEGALVRDEALLENARLDLKRYETLVKQDAVPEQQLATQRALVIQDEGIVKTDQGTIDSAKLNLVYCHVTAPITGRIGLRLVDPGNIVHAADSNGLLVITQVDPISVIFTLAEDQLPVVAQKLHGGNHLEVDAFDRSSKKELSAGKLATIDNQIDQTTGTLKLRAIFDNRTNILFPNQFVNVRLLVQLKQGVTIIPEAAVQRNSQMTYAFLVKPDNTVAVQQITIGTTEAGQSEVISGLNPGDVVVMTGVDKLTNGSKVNVHFEGERSTPGRPESTAPVPGNPAHGARKGK